MAGGIGRFAAGRKKPAQQQQNDASGNNDGGGGSKQQPNVNINNNGTTTNVNNNNTAAPTNNNNTNNNMEVERPSTAFNSFNSINNADADRPATSGSHGFSAINNMMFGGANDNDDDGMMMMDDNNGVGNFGLDNSTAAATATEFGQGFTQSFDPMAAAEAAFQDFGGFNTTDNNNSAEGGGDEQQPVVGGMGVNNGNGNEKNVEQPVVAEKQPPIASVQEQQPKSNVGGVGGGGVGRFSKKRIVNTTTAAAKSSSTQQPSALAVLANAATETATLMSNADKFSPIRNPTTAVAVMNKSVVDNNNSSSDLSRFDIDLMSKNTDNAVGKSNDNDEGVMNVEDADKEAAVPTSIRTSGDDVEDDLTEATATTYDGDIFHEAKTDDATAGEKESSKTSPYFANVATNNQVATKQNEENVGNMTKTTSLVEDVVTDADVQQQPSPKLGGNDVMNVQPPVQTAVQTAIPTNTNDGRTLSQGSSGAPRVSLSPRGPSSASANVMNQGGDTASSLSPKGMTSRPNQNNIQQANTFKVNDDDDNSIVIPGISSAVANNPDFSQQAATVARLSNTINNVRQPGSHQQMNNNRSFQPPSSSSSAKGRMTSATLQKPVLNRQKKQPPFMMNRNTMTTSNSCDIVTEKVTFALPKSRPTTTNNSNMMMSSNQKTGSSLARANAAAGSTAITPDSRGVENNNQVAAAATPFGRQSDTSSGSETSSGDDLSPHKDQAFVPTSNTVQPPKKTMEPRVEEFLPQQQQQRRPRSQTITSPPEALLTAPAQSETPKVSNVNQPSSSTIAAASSYHHNNNSAFHTDETFDELLSQFVKDIQDGTDIYEKGQNDLLGLNVEVTHAYSRLLRYKDEYKELLADIEGVQAMAESVMAEISVE